jgi:hypothetical protein
LAFGPQLCVHPTESFGSERDWKKPARRLARHRRIGIIDRQNPMWLGSPDCPCGLKASPMIGCGLACRPYYRELKFLVSSFLEIRQRPCF